MIKVINNYSSFVVKMMMMHGGHFHVTLFIADHNNNKKNRFPGIGFN